MGILTNIVKDLAGAQKEILSAQKEAFSQARSAQKEALSAQKDLLSGLFKGKKGKSQDDDQDDDEVKDEDDQAEEDGLAADAQAKVGNDSEAFIFCGQCGKKFAAGARFCPECGAPAPEPVPFQAAPVVPLPIPVQVAPPPPAPVQAAPVAPPPAPAQAAPPPLSSSGQLNGTPPASPGAPAQSASPAQAAPAFVPGGDYVLPVPAGVLRLTRENARLPGGFSGVLVIPEGVKIIESNCFSDQKDITELRLPKSLTRIRGNAFCDDNGDTPESLLEKITIGANVQLEEPYWDIYFYSEYVESQECKAGTYVKKNDRGDYSWELVEE